MNTVEQVLGQRIVALMGQPSHDIYGNFISPTKNYTPSALKKAMGGRVPIADIRRAIESLCEQGVVKSVGIVLPMFGHKREAIYTLTQEGK
jgi:hypothetical protein